MIKKFSEHVNEDYFSKLANRKDNGDKRKENEVTEELVRSYILSGAEFKIKSISFRKENGKTVVDINGVFCLRDDVEEIPFQFGRVRGDFYCSFCDSLKSLKGCPQEVIGDFYSDNCDILTSLEGCPKEVNGDFLIRNCGKQFTIEDVKSLCNVKGKIYV